MSATATTNPLLESSDLPKFTKIEPSQLTPAMTSILEKLESDFANMESTMGGKDIDYDDVLPVVEKMQHPLVSEIVIYFVLYIIYIIVFLGILYTDLLCL